MTYIDGVVLAVPTANREAYLAHSREVAALVKKLGALSIVENWGDDIPEGKLNSLHTAVMRKADETVVFSWITWPSKAVRDAAWHTIRTDTTLPVPDVPYDGKRMIWGGFETILEA